MIDLKLEEVTEDTTNIEKFKLLTEGILEDSLKAAANVDAAKIKDSWNNASDKAGKVKVAADAAKEVGSGLAKKADDLTYNYNKGRSIVARAKNSILQFPIYVTQSIRANEAQIIAKTFERVYATLVQTVLAQNPIVDNEDEINGLAFLKSFHTNITESTSNIINSYYEAIDKFDQIMCDSIFYSESINQNLDVEFRLVPTNNEYLIAENARLANESLQGLFEIKEAATPAKQNVDIEANADKEISDSEFQNILRSYNASLKANNQPEVTLKDLKERIQKGANITNDNAQIINFKLVGNRPIYYVGTLKMKTKTKQDDKANTRITPSVATPTLTANDIKKINGLLPYTIEATFRIKNENREVKFLIGVKSIMHLISPKDLAEDLKEIVMGNEKTLQKIRYKTGEISFKDYFFNIKQVKADAAKHINYNKRWLNTLKRLGEYKKMVGPAISDIAKLTNGAYPIPNGTMILSYIDIVKLKNDTGIDLNVISNVKRLAKSLFLIAFVIVDITSGTMKVLFPDDSNDWDIQSLASIDAEVSKTDNSQLMKELNRLVNK